MRSELCAAEPTRQCWAHCSWLRLRLVLRRCRVLVAAERGTSGAGTSRVPAIGSLLHTAKTQVVAGTGGKGADGMLRGASLAMGYAYDTRACTGGGGDGGAPAAPRKCLSKLPKACGGILTILIAVPFHVFATKRLCVWRDLRPHLAQFR
jgi:hypothetical protein